MNPGLMKSRLQVERQTDERDAIGQPLNVWVYQFSVRARRMRDKGSDNDPMISGRERERHRATYRIRSVREKCIMRGDRIRSLAGRGHTEVIWDVTAIDPVADPLWVDVICESVV